MLPPTQTPEPQHVVTARALLRELRNLLPELSPDMACEVAALNRRLNGHIQMFGQTISTEAA